MSDQLTGDDVLAGRYHLEKTQAELSVDLDMVGITTINRWENGHAAPSGAWSKIVSEYFVKKVGKDWKKTVRTPRFKVLLEVRALASEQGRRVKVSPTDDIKTLKELRRSLKGDS